MNVKVQRPPGQGGATDQLGQAIAAADDRCSRSIAQPRERTLEQLRHQRGERYLDHVGRLKAAGIFTSWPTVLDLDPPVPLKIGISRQLEARLDLSRCEFRTLLELIRRHVVSPPYLRAMIAPGAMRHDIDGNQVEPVSKEHRSHAYSRPGWRHREAARREAKIAAAAEKRWREDHARRSAVARAVVRKIRATPPIERVIVEHRANVARPILRLRG